MKNNDYIINDQIRDAEVRVISEEGEMLGVMPTGEAIRRADEAGLDLIMISPNAAPPVCRIEDFGKFRYEQLRKEKENKKK
ncbi:MAG: translation initiation factor IF-3, partial [Lachnospiraceae bacterium]|nr:translation initiation factor IF-3 [Lachnospiraceae bacterium]